MSAALLSATAGSLCGIAALAILRRFSNQPAIRVSRARMRAHLYELRLFGDEPLLMMRALRKLVSWNLRYLRFTLPPACLIAVPVLLTLLQLDALFGKRPLLQGEAVVVTAQLASATLPQGFDPILVATPPFRVDSPSVRIAGGAQVCWRVRAAGGTDGLLQLTLPGEIVKLPIRSGPGTRYVSPLCNSSWRGWISGGCRIESNSLQSVAIEYPDGATAWLAWFSLVLLATMLALRRRFGVAF